MRNSKKEENQEGFVRELLVFVLGYTSNSQPDFNFVLGKNGLPNLSKSMASLFADQGK